MCLCLFLSFLSRSFLIVLLPKTMEETDNTFAGQYLQWTRNLKGIPPFTHELLTQHLITDISGKQEKLPNAHKHKIYGYQLFKDKMVSKVKSGILKATE